MLMEPAVVVVAVGLLVGRVIRGEGINVVLGGYKEGCSHGRGTGNVHWDMNRSNLAPLGSG